MASTDKDALIAGILGFGAGFAGSKADEMALNEDRAYKEALRLRVQEGQIAKERRMYQFKSQYDSQAAKNTLIQQGYLNADGTPNTTGLPPEIAARVTVGNVKALRDAYDSGIVGDVDEVSDAARRKAAEDAALLEKLPEGAYDPATGQFDMTPFKDFPVLGEGLTVNNYNDRVKQAQSAAITRDRDKYVADNTPYVVGNKLVTRTEASKLGKEGYTIPDTPAKTKTKINDVLSDGSKMVQSIITGKLTDKQRSELITSSKPEYFTRSDKEQSAHLKRFIRDTITPSIDAMIKNADQEVKDRVLTAGPEAYSDMVVGRVNNVYSEIIDLMLQSSDVFNNEYRTNIPAGEWMGLDKTAATTAGHTLLNEPRMWSIGGQQQEISITDRLADLGVNNDDMRKLLINAMIKSGNSMSMDSIK